MRGVTTWLGRAVVLVTLFLLASALPATQPTEKPKPLPAELVAAWKKAGAKVGWLRPGRFGTEFIEASKDQAGKPGDVPAFRVASWNEGMVTKLPAPDVPFGLDLGGTKITDVGLKELAGFKQLKRLDVSGTEITDAGLKELAGFKQLETLSLFSTSITDAGLKEVARLKQLQTLILDETPITDAGLKELAGLKQLKRLNLTITEITNAGVQALRKALPECKIRY